MKKRVFIALAVSIAAVLSGCSSVPLDNVPVEDKSGSAVNTTPGSQTQSSVATVRADDVTGTSQGPANVSRLVYFDFDSYSIKPEYQSLIEQHARFLKSDGKRHVVIEGHTDDRGGREYNLALGQRRSEAVRRALGLLGVGEQQVEAVSFGKEKPAAPGTDEAARAQNRRAEIMYR